MNKHEFIEKLQEKTGRSEQDCIVINSILEDHFIVGKNNQEKIKSDFMDKLGVDEKEADELYNICAESIVKGIFRKD